MSPISRTDFMILRPGDVLSVGDTIPGGPHDFEVTSVSDDPSENGQPRTVVAKALGMKNGYLDIVLTPADIDRITFLRAAPEEFGVPLPPGSSRARTISGEPLTPGVNVDAIDIETGVEMAKRLGFTSAEHLMVAEYGLQRWARGEEDGALRTFLSGDIDLTSAYAIIAAARSTAAPAPEPEEPPAPQADLGVTVNAGVVTLSITSQDPAVRVAIDVERDTLLDTLAEVLGVEIHDPQAIVLGPPTTQIQHSHAHRTTDAQE